MRNHPSAPEKEARLNQFLSAFLVIAYVICMYFISSWISTIPNATLKYLTFAGLYIVFGLLLFYATRVGEGKQIHRFSLSVLLLMVVPGLYILLASLVTGMPLSAEIGNSSTLQILGYVMLGYGIPYTFVSGYERVTPETEEGDGVNTFGIAAASDEAADEETFLEEEMELEDDPADAEGEEYDPEGETAPEAEEDQKE